MLHFTTSHKSTDSYLWHPRITDIITKTQDFPLYSTHYRKSEDELFLEEITCNLALTHGQQAMTRL